MDSFKEKLFRLKIQDLVAMTLCVLFIYLLRVKEKYVLSPAWHVGTLSNLPKDESTPNPVSNFHLPRPVVTDLDGDKKMEVVLISPEKKLLIGIYSGMSQSKQLSELTIHYQVSLPVSRYEDGSYSQPYVIETGYLTEYQAANQTRQQFIVVVMDSWEVLCYNSTLGLLWQNKMMDVSKIHPQYSVKAMGVLVAPVSIEKGDQGVVIVGASYGHTAHNSRSIHLSDGQSNNTHVNEDDRTFSHFSTFALSGKNGTIRWHHLPGDFEKKVPKYKIHHWKLEFKRNTHHTGEMHWTKYKSTILKHMPLYWDKLSDTKFDLADVKQVDTPPDTQPPTPLVDILGSPDDHLPGLFYGGAGPHSRHDHVKHPNALVIQNNEGIEVLRLHTGQPLTHLKYSQHKSVYTDINDDGSIEQLVIKTSGLSCHAYASTIHPKPAAVFSVPVCEAMTWSASDSYLSSSVDLLTGDDVSVPPLLVKSVAKKRGFVNHLLGRSLRSERRGYDSIYITSFGRVTSYSSDGELNWQTVVGAHWYDKIIRNKDNDNDFTENKDGYLNNHFYPSFVSMSKKVYGKKNIGVVSGWNTLLLIDLQDGHILVEHTLPCQPSDKPIIADFTTDGLNDIIVPCPQGFLGFTVRSQPSYFYMVLVSITVILSVLLLSWCCHPDYHAVYEPHDFSTTYNVD